MKITIKIPKGFKDDIELDLTYPENEIPFSDGKPNEEIVADLNHQITNEQVTEYEGLNAFQLYVQKNIGGEVAPLGTYDDEVEVIPVG